MYSAQSAPISRAVQSLALPAGVTAMTLLLLLLTLLLPIALAAQERPDSITRAALPEVVISASGFEQSRRDAPASITVISRQQLEQQRTSDLADVLRGVEGIDVGGTSGKTGGLNVSLRGMPAEYTLILVDGRRQNAAGNVTPNGFRETETSFLPPPSAIERVEIIRGPMATLYGSDAMGGVINIITRKTRSSWSGSLSTDATLQEESEFGNSFGATTWISGPVISERLTLDLRGSVFQRREATLSPSGEFGDGTQISARGPSPVRADRHSIGSKLELKKKTK